MSIEEVLKERKRLRNKLDGARRKARRLADKLAVDPHYLTPAQRKLEAKKSYKNLNEEYDRECLKCDDPFVARGKYVRTCNKCKIAHDRNNWREAIC